MILKLSDVRDWLKTLELGTDNFYIGKLDNKKDKSIGVYQLRNNHVNVAIGGLDNTKTLEKSVSILIHWNMNAKETEEKALELYYKLLNAKEFKINNIKINYIKLLVSEPVDVGTDDKNIYERVIEATFYYEKGAEE